MRKLLVAACILSFLAVALTAVNLLAPHRLAQAADRLPLISAVRIADRYDANRMAKVDEGGSLQVADQRLQFEQNDKAAAGSLKVSQQGPVAVGNFPPVQSVAGTVNVGNLLATQPVSGSVNVGNLPATQDVRVTNSSLPVSGTVNVGNLPATQQVQGTVNVANFPALQPVSGVVSLDNLPLDPDGRLLVSAPAARSPQLFALLEGVSVPGYRAGEGEPVVWVNSGYVDVRGFKQSRWYARHNLPSWAHTDLLITLGDSLDGVFDDSGRYCSDYPTTNGSSCDGPFRYLRGAVRYDLDGTGRPAGAPPLPSSAVVSLFLYAVP
ncbi:MAG: hypothetical protein Q8O40_15990 [Chloroflexota bacterium]|nr:hypothetical protein [Chloroflexota bacterium]